MLHLAHIIRGQVARLIDQALFAHGGELVSHRLALSIAQHHQRLAGINSAHLGRQEHNLDTVKILVGRIVVMMTAGRVFFISPPIDDS